MEGMVAPRPDEAAILPAPATLRPRHILWRFTTTERQENGLL